MIEINMSLTFRELEAMVLEGKIPLYIIHRYLCHPENECEDGCDAHADPERMAKYNRSLCQD